MRGSSALPLQFSFSAAVADAAFARGSAGQWVSISGLSLPVDHLTLQVVATEARTALVASGGLDLTPGPTAA
jgi:hypothetical protein